MSPLSSRATAKRLHRLAKSHAAAAECRLCFRRLKKDGENCGELYGKKGKKPDAFASHQGIAAKPPP